MKRQMMILISMALPLLLVGCVPGDRPSIHTRDNVDKEQAANLSGKGDHPDFCAVYDWYGDGICDDFCHLPDPDCDDSCPDPTDPGVSYQSTDLDVCAAMAVDCAPGWAVFDDACGCGCVTDDAGDGDEPGGTPDHCPDPNDPDVDYISQDVDYCGVILFACEDGETGFSDECGCGCIADEPDTPDHCPDPNDPDVDYISQDVDYCGVILFACEDDETGFSDECGCGCIAN